MSTRTLGHEDCLQADEECLRLLAEREPFAVMFNESPGKDMIQSALEKMYGIRKSEHLMRNLRDHILLTALKRIAKALKVYSYRDGQKLNWSAIFSAFKTLDVRKVDSECMVLVLGAVIHAAVHYVCCAKNVEAASEKAVSIVLRGKYLLDRDEVRKAREEGVRLVEECARQGLQHGQTAMVREAVKYEKKRSLADLVEELEAYAQGLADNLGEMRVLCKREATVVDDANGEPNPYESLGYSRRASSGHVRDVDRGHDHRSYVNPPEDDEEGDGVEGSAGKGRDPSYEIRREASHKRLHAPDSSPAAVGSSGGNQFCRNSRKRRRRGMSMDEAADRTVAVKIGDTPRSALKETTKPNNQESDGSSPPSAGNARNKARPAENAVNRGDHRSESPRPALMDVNDPGMNSEDFSGTDDEESSSERGVQTRRRQNLRSRVAVPRRNRAISGKGDSKNNESDVDMDSAAKPRSNLGKATDALKEAVGEDPINSVVEQAQHATGANGKARARTPSPFTDDDDEEEKSKRKRWTRKHPDSSVLSDESTPQRKDWKKSATPRKGRGHKVQDIRTPEGFRRGKFSHLEDDLLRQGLEKYGWSEWQRISDFMEKKLTGKRSSVSLKDRARTMKLRPSDYPPTFGYKRPGPQSSVLPVLKSGEKSRSQRLADRNEERENESSAEKTRPNAEEKQESIDSYQDSGDEHSKKSLDSDVDNDMDEEVEEGEKLVKSGQKSARKEHRMGILGKSPAQVGTSNRDGEEQPTPEEKPGEKEEREDTASGRDSPHSSHGEPVNTNLRSAHTKGQESQYNLRRSARNKESEGDE